MPPALCQPVLRMGAHAHHLTLQVDFTQEVKNVTFGDKWKTAVDSSETTPGTAVKVGVSEEMCANLVGWEMSVIADTSRVLNYKRGTVTSHI